MAPRSSRTSSLWLLGSLVLLTGCDAFRTHDSEYDFPAVPAPAPSSASTNGPAKKPVPYSPGYAFDPYARTTSRTPYVKIDTSDSYTCALRDSNQLDCWGGVLTGQPSALVELSASAKTACGVDPNGAVQCWGATGGFVVPIGEKLSSIGVGDGFACALDPQGQPHCWGPSAIAPPPDTVLTQLAVGTDHACGLDAKGKAICWGNGEAAKPDAEDGPYFEIAAGSRTTCAIRTGSHTLSCWGLLDASQLTPVSVEHVAVTMGKACGLTETDEVVCWGLSRTNGQIVDWLAPPTSVRFSSLSLAPTHACGIRHDNGLALCWGRETSGEVTPPF